MNTPKAKPRMTTKEKTELKQAIKASTAREKSKQASKAKPKAKRKVAPVSAEETAESIATASDNKQKGITKAEFDKMVAKSKPKAKAKKEKPAPKPVNRGPLTKPKKRGPIHESAMLVRVNFSALGSRRKDKKESDDLVERNDAEDGSLTAIKSIFDKKDLAEIKGARAAARGYLRRSSLPWSDAGDRIISTESYAEFNETMTFHKTRFEKAVQALVENYDSVMQSAKDRLNGLFNAEDYPSKAELADKFAFTTSVSPVPQTTDFRTNLGDETNALLAKSMEKELEDRAKQATEELLSRLKATITKMVNLLSDPDRKVTERTISKVRDAVENLSKMNLTDNKKIDSLAVEIDKMLTLQTVDPKAIKTSKTARSKVYKDGKAALDKINETMGGIL